MGNHALAHDEANAPVTSVFSGPELSEEHGPEDERRGFGGWGRRRAPADGPAEAAALHTAAQPYVARHRAS